MTFIIGRHIDSRLTASAAPSVSGSHHAHVHTGYAGVRFSRSVPSCLMRPQPILSFQHKPARCRRAATTTVCAAKPHKVALLGAAGGIGQPLGLLLKMQPYVTELALYDIANVAGVAADLSHCNTPVKVIIRGTEASRLSGILQPAIVIFHFTCTRAKRLQCVL